MVVATAPEGRLLVLSEGALGGRCPGDTARGRGACVRDASAVWGGSVPGAAGMRSCDRRSSDGRTVGWGAVLGPRHLNLGRARGWGLPGQAGLKTWVLAPSRESKASWPGAPELMDSPAPTHSNQRTPSRPVSRRLAESPSSLCTLDPRTPGPPTRPRPSR